jgi:hypothetical protein
MGYCSESWVSDYTYRSVLTFRGSAAGAQSTDAAARAIPIARALVIRGTVDAEHGVTLDPVFVVDTRPSAVDAAGRYVIEGTAEDGRVLFTRAVTPTPVAHAPGISQFSFALASTSEIEAALASVNVRGPRGSATLARAPAPAALRVASDIAPRRVAGGLVQVACADAGARGILVSDAESGAVFAMEHGSTARVVAPVSARLTVTCSDGVQSSRTVVIAP